MIAFIPTNEQIACWQLFSTRLLGAFAVLYLVSLVSGLVVDVITGREHK